MKKFLLTILSLLTFLGISQVFALPPGGGWGPIINTFTSTLTASTSSVHFDITLTSSVYDLSDYSIDYQFNSNWIWNSLDYVDISTEPSPYSTTTSEYTLPDWPGQYSFRITAHNYDPVTDWYFQKQKTIWPYTLLSSITPPPPPSPTWVYWPNTLSTGCPANSVPASNSLPAPTSGSLSCVSHHYYSADDYYTTNSYTDNSGIFWCGPGELMVDFNASTKQLKCRKYDDVPPTCGTWSPADGSVPWVNHNQTFTLSTSTDTWWSGINVAWDSCVVALNGQTCIVTISDRAGNTTDCVSPAAKIDRNVPVAWDISESPSTNSNFLATPSKSFSLTVNDGGEAPIVSIKTEFENAANPSTFTSYNSTNSSLNFSGDISKVDNDRSSGWRNYKWKVTEICDAAANCTSNLATYNYYVFANSSSITPTTHLDDGIADGTWNKFTAVMRDAYGNAIVPANLNGLTRQIKFSFDFNNGLFLDQTDTASSSSAVWFKDAIWTTSVWIGASNQSRIQTPDGSDSYNFAIQSYSPTATTIYNIPLSGNTLTMWPVIASVIDSSGLWNTSKALTSSMPVKFYPVFYTKITGDIVMPWFLAWAQQSSHLEVVGIPSSRWWWEFSNWYIKGVFTSPKFDLFYWTGNIDTLSTMKNISIKPDIIPDFATHDYSLHTFLKQKSGVTTSAASNAKIESIVKYSLDWHNIAYYSDDVGITKNTNSAFQVGVKILWVTASKNANEILTWQFGNDVKLLNGTPDSFILKSQVLKNAGITTKNIEWSLKDAPTDINNSQLNGGDFTGGSEKWITLTSGSQTVLYIKTSGNKNITISNNMSISGNRTLLVVWGNIYIKGNINYADSSALLSLIALKDSSGNGWNIYIKPNVTDISATLFASKAVLSYDDALWEIGWDNATADLLKNQLYIFGSVVSLNTIGGANSGKCPYYVGSCSESEAQKYDLNYLRRYFIDPTTNSPNKWGNPSSNPKANTYRTYPVIIEYNPQVQKDPSGIFSTK